MKLRLFLIVSWLAAGICHGFVGKMSTAGRWRSWNLNAPAADVHTNALNRSTHAIRYFLGSATYSASQTAELNALRTSFAQWQAVPNSSLKFEEGGLAGPNIDINTQDNTNVVFWATKSTLVNGGRDNISGLCGVEFKDWNANELYIYESDIVLNGVDFRWTTSPDDTSGALFVESVMLHEIGHLVGLEHSPAGAALMMVRGDFGVGNLAGLTTDEQCAVRWLYPTGSSLSNYGYIYGQALLGFQTVLGAMITAEDSHGNLMAATLSRADGSYSLPAMPPGAYQVRATPLGLAVNIPLLIGEDISKDYAAARTDFLPTSPVNITVASNKYTQANFSLTAGNPPFPILRLRPPTDQPGGLLYMYNGTLSLAPGQSNFYLGVYGITFPPGVDLKISGDGITVTNVTLNQDPFHNGFWNMLSAKVQVASNATPGMRTLMVELDQQVAYANGFLEIKNPAPDQNYDGLNDLWQRKYFPLWTAAEAGPSADPDRDGVINRFEYSLGTNPLVPDLQASIATTTAGQVALTWPSSPGRRYQVWTTPQTAPTTWAPLRASVTATATNTVFSDVILPNTQRYYLIQILP